MANRIVAFLIDHMIICFALAFLGFAQMLIKTDLLWLWRMYYIIFLAFLFAYFFKDVVNGQSVGKRIMKIKVVDMDGNKPSIFNLIIRNITIFIWPVEAILVLLNKQRLGDILAKTKVVDK
ncbi:MAG: RDD family protein [Ruminococcaceae bacterium]|nr:RDD family protein [Oscillospiraceae bacterium]